MAREHARILTRIWRDDAEWRALPWEGQHMYFVLLSQPVLTHAGTLPLTLTRWSGLTEDRTVADVEKAVRLLEERRFVVIDWETEELMIRSFIRNDGVYRQPNVLKAAMRVLLDEVESSTLKEAAGVELARVGMSQYAAQLSRNPSPNPSGKGSAERSAEPSGEGSAEGPSTLPTSPAPANPAGNPSGKGSAGVTDQSRGRGVGGVGTSCSVGGSVSEVAPKRDSSRGTRLDPEWVPAPDVRDKLTAEFPAVDQRAEFAKFRDYWAGAPGAKGRKADWTATYRNWIRRAAENAPAASRRSGGRPGRSDLAMAAVDAVRAKYGPDVISLRPAIGGEA